MSAKIKYNGLVVARVAGGNVATLPVKDLKMKSDIEVAAEGAAECENSVHIGSEPPDTDANVWIDPNGSPTGTTEEWTFTLEDGSTVKKIITVLK